MTRRSRPIVHLAGLVVAVVVFLRAPFHDAAPFRTWWPPPKAPIASASVLEHERPFATGPANPTVASAPPAVFALSPYWYHPPSDVLLPPVAPAGDSIGGLIEERLSLLEGFGDRAAGRDVLFLIGAQHQSVGDFERAADFYEAFLSHPNAEVCETENGMGCDAAAASLENAIMFRRALGDTERALTNADVFETRFAAQHPRAATRIAFASADLDDEGRVERLRRLTRRRLPPAEAIQAAVRLGKALWSSDRRGAQRAFRRAERIWRVSEGPMMAASPGLEPTAWVAELGRTREALAEARYFEARRRYRVAAQTAAPAYKGTRRQAHVERWVERRLRPWMARRLRAIRGTERALDRVDALGLSRWTVPAAALRGQVYQDLADAIVQLEVPREIVVDDESIGAVVQYREPVHEHLVVPALDHFRACMALARETRGYGEASDRCADGLARYEPRWRRPAELRPSRLLLVDR
ncbi:MAG: hypothetical protein AAGE52_12520 [Myxococcota bacterium]